MIEVTIKTDFEENGAVCSTEKRMDPCDLALVACISPRDDERSYHSNISLVGRGGLDICGVSGSLAAVTVKALLELAGDSRECQAQVFAAYMENFIDKASEMAGTAVMDRTAKLVMEEE